MSRVLLSPAPEEREPAAGRKRSGVPTPLRPGSRRRMAALQQPSPARRTFARLVESPVRAAAVPESPAMRGGDWLSPSRLATPFALDSSSLDASRAALAACGPWTPAPASSDQRGAAAAARRRSMSSSASDATDECTPRAALSQRFFGEPTTPPPPPPLPVAGAAARAASAAAASVDGELALPVARARAPSFSLPTPDPLAFEEGRAAASRGLRMSPPSPMRKPFALVRKNSLWDNKALFSFHHSSLDDQATSALFELDFIGAGCFFEVFRCVVGPRPVGLRAPPVHTTARAARGGRPMTPCSR